jgi:TatD family-associated radical SAM protein
MTIFYRLGAAVYVNITNACPCDCVFCIRKLTDGVGTGESLWLPHEPTLDELKAAFDAYYAEGGFSGCREIVFCGYGEPMTRAETVIDLTEYMSLAMQNAHGQHDMKERISMPVRLNTNGLVRLMFPDFDMNLLSHFSCVSVSMNADDMDEYNRNTRPRWTKTAYNEMLQFAADAKAFTRVVFTAVSGTISRERMANCRKKAAAMGIEFRER